MPVETAAPLLSWVYPYRDIDASNEI